MQQDVIQRLTALQGGLDGDLEVVDDAALADVVRQAARAQAALKRGFLVLRFRRDQAIFGGLRHAGIVSRAGAGLHPPLHGLRRFGHLVAGGELVLHFPDDSGGEPILVPVDECLNGRGVTLAEFTQRPAQRLDVQVCAFIDEQLADCQCARGVARAEMPLIQRNG